MADGSDAIADWPLLNALVNTASGATWVSIHHGGGVGIGRSIHAGQVIGGGRDGAGGGEAGAGAGERPGDGGAAARGRGLPGGGGRPRRRGACGSRWRSRTGSTRAPRARDPARPPLQQGGLAATALQQSWLSGTCRDAAATAAFDRMWADLARLGRHPGTGGYRRFAWTREDADLREWFAGEAAARGLDLVDDRAGNLWAWWGDPDRDGPGVVLGSHLDSVPDGGAFDGPLGVVSALAAVDALRARGVRPGPAARRRRVRRRGGRPVRRRVRRVAADHRARSRPTGPAR